MSTVLIGYRGCGKTTIGRKLADHLWQKFVDTDEMIAAKAGQTIAQIFADVGEAGFRQLEVEAVREASRLEEHVIALGGGAPLREENREIIKSAGHRVVYLRCEPEELLKRAQADPETASTRPGALESAAEIGKVLEVREPIYRQMMDAELQVTYLNPAEAMVYIVRLL